MTMTQPVIPDLMSREEAAEIVATIRGHARNMRVLLRDLERRRGWQSLGHRSFDAFLEAEFDWSPNYAHRQLRAAEVEENLSVPIGTLREAQARELASLPADVQRQVWERVGTDSVTAKRIREVAAEVLPREPELPANGGEPEPEAPPLLVTAFPAEVTLNCAECGRRFEEILAAGQTASRTCPKCRGKAARPLPKILTEHTLPVNPAPAREDREAPAKPEQAAGAAATAAGAEAEEPTSAVVACTATLISSVAPAKPEPAPPEMSDASLSVDAISDAEILRVVREVAVQIPGGLTRLLQVMARPSFVAWMVSRGKGK